MTLQPEERQAIVDYRVERAYKTLEELDYVVKGGYWNLAANRLYYAAFYMCEALLLKHQISAQTHAGVSRMISLHFIREGLLSDADKALLGRLFRMRQTGDYDDLSDWDESEILGIIPAAKSLVAKIGALVK